MLTESSFNGSIMALDNMKPGVLSIPANSVDGFPYALNMPLFCPQRRLLYVPNEWTEVKFLMKNTVLAVWAEHEEYRAKHIMLSVLPASLAATAVEGKTVSLLTSPQLNLVSLSPEILHPTHNLVLSWVDDYSEAHTLNRMM